MRRLALALVLALLPSTAHAASAPDAGTAFEPTPQSQPLYGSQPPSADPARQRHVVRAVDGIDLYVETWLPAAKEGHEPPARVPTILVMTPYVKQGVPETQAFVTYMNARGYAVAMHHVRGTGESGGCLEQTAELQIDDGGRVIQFLGRDAPWTDGNVGMYGASYPGETQVSVAGRAPQDRIKYLKAIIPTATVGGQYEYSHMDGVPYAGQAALSNSTYLTLTSLMPGATSTPRQFAEKMTCQPEVLGSSVTLTGDMTPFWRLREYRPEVENIRAATLWVHGLRDFNVQPITVAGFFDRLPATTPHKGLFGVWNHAFPSSHPRVEPEWARPDWLPMATAWFDRYLKGLDTGVEGWPDVQVQSSDGQWRAEPEWPATGGPAGQLALAPGGRLGGDAGGTPTSFREGPDDAETVQGTRAVFTTQPLTAPLQLTGQPVLDLWMTSDRNDGHVAARLEVLGANGQPLRHAGTSAERVATYGFRSLQHLDPMPANHFLQASGKPVTPGAPLRVPVRFQPTDLTVPAGGRLRLTVSGALQYSRIGQPSGAGATFTLLHDCARPSVLRFNLPRTDAPLLNVRETDEADAPLASVPQAAGARDGAGVAGAPVCGTAPVDPLEPVTGAPVSPPAPSPARGPRRAPSR
jgi:X-Pro dipeptidyl-peptidase